MTTSSVQRRVGAGIGIAASVAVATAVFAGPASAYVDLVTFVGPDVGGWPLFPTDIYIGYQYTLTAQEAGVLTSPMYTTWDVVPGWPGDPGWDPSKAVALGGPVLVDGTYHSSMQWSPTAAGHFTVEVRDTGTTTTGLYQWQLTVYDPAVVRATTPYPCPTTGSSGLGSSGAGSSGSGAPTKMCYETP